MKVTRASAGTRDVGSDEGGEDYEWLANERPPAIWRSTVELWVFYSRDGAELSVQTGAHTRGIFGRRRNRYRGTHGRTKASREPRAARRGGESAWLRRDHRD